MLATGALLLAAASIGSAHAPRQQRRHTTTQPHQPSTPLGHQGDDSGVLNVRRLGAVGDGQADDTAAIQHALELAERSSPPPMLLFPAGDYRVSATLNISCHATDITLSGYQATLVAYVNGPTLSIGDAVTPHASARRITVLGLAFRSQGPSNPVAQPQHAAIKYPQAVAIRVQAVMGLFLRDLYLSQYERFGLQLDKSPAIGAAYLNNVVLETVEVRWTGLSALVVGRSETAGAADDITIIGCLFNNAGLLVPPEQPEYGGVVIASQWLEFSGTEVSGMWRFGAISCPSPCPLSAL